MKTLLKNTLAGGTLLLLLGSCGSVYQCDSSCDLDHGEASCFSCKQECVCAEKFKVDEKFDLSK
jgi:hypothetical protein